MVLTTEALLEIVGNCQKELMEGRKIAYSCSRKWTGEFPRVAGVYAIFDSRKLVYIGETANLKERMKDVRRTINHTFRRKLCKQLYKDATLVNGKYDSETELKLNEYCCANISFSYKEINYGRLEIESYLIHNNKGLLNTPGKRNKLNYG